MLNERIWDASQGSPSHLIVVRTEQIGGAPVQTVNARELHEFLGVGKMFAHWIAERIKRYGFSENQDFVIGLPVSANQSGRGGDRRGREYHITLDMAKELSMVERNARGKQARQYFIECERRLKKVSWQNPSNLSRLEILSLALQSEQERLALERKVEAMQPKADALDRIASSDGSMCMTDAAKNLQMPPQQLIKWLHAHKWIYKRTGNKHWIGYQECMQRGLVEHKVSTITLEGGGDKIVEQVRITSKGLARLAVIFRIEPAAAAAR